MIPGDYTAYMKLFDVLSSSGFRNVNRIAYCNVQTSELICLEYAGSAGSIYLADILRIIFNKPFPKGLENILPEEDVIIKYDSQKNKNIMQIDFLDERFSNISLIDDLVEAIKEEFDIKKAMNNKPKIDMNQLQKDYNIRNEKKLARELKKVYF